MTHRSTALVYLCCTVAVMALGGATSGGAQTVGGADQERPARRRPASMATAPQAAAVEADAKADADVSDFAQTLASPNVDVVTLGETNLVPPDTMGDAGPSQYLVAVNGRIRTINKSTGATDGALNMSLNLFFDSVRQGQLVSNPRVRYDRRVGRWYVLGINLVVPNRIMLAVSSSADITGGTSWEYFALDNARRSVPADQPCLADFPTLGVDEDALYVGANQFCGAALGSLTLDSTSGYVINKASVLDGVQNNTLVTTFHGLALGLTGEGPYTPQGVDNFDSNTNVGYFIGVDNGALGQLQMRRVLNPGSAAPTISGNIPIPVATTELPIDVPHPGSAVPLDAQDDRLSQAVIRGGRLWTSHQIEVDAAGQAALGGGRNAIRWYELQNLDTAPALRQLGTVFDSAASSPVSYFMSSVMVSGQGHMAMGSTVAGASAFVNAMTAGRLSSDAPGQINGPPQVFTSNAAASYNVEPLPATQQKWGGYSYTSVDPNDDMTMWTLQQYVNGTNSFALRLVRLQAPPPASIVSVSPPSVTPGRSAVVVTVTGSAVGGAGFFDPGPGFPNRLTTTLASSGIVVTNVTVVSPTVLTLTLDTTGAVVGSHQLTITNPDGQLATRGNAVTVQPNLPPVAVADGYSTRANGTLTVAPPGVLANDSDPNGEAMTSALQSGPSHGSVTLDANGSFTYTPAAGYSGPDAFSYVASDGLLTSGAVTVALTVTPNEIPTASADAYVTAFNAALNVPAPGILSNDSDADGDALAALLISGPAHGSLTLNGNGSFLYTPTAGFAGTDSFVYRASDGAAISAPAAVTLTVSQPTTVQPPTVLVASRVSGTTVTLRWTAPPVGPIPTGYVLEGGVLPGEVLASIPTNSAAPIFTFVAPPGSFYVRMHALSGSERSAASNEIRIHVNVPVAPSAPAGLVSLVNGSTLNLSWRNTFAGGAPASLLLDVTGTAVATLPLDLSDSAGFTGVPGGTYTLRLRATNAGGASSQSDPVTVTIPSACTGVPQPPADVLAYLTGSTATVIWNPAATGSAATSFTVNVTGAFVGSFGTPGRSLSGVVSRGTYVISVVASNACGASAPSAVQTLVVP
jgi:Bacterial Ig domain